ncbi:glycosyltransferase family 4 protein [Sneathiella litorea]|uniref:Glycosyltransferase n=1 Tax=Sneathiella litorea TaxID=2606216 RepID=A0A6L8WE05_9PROT|nr:glycosyltransferase family 4 protein [Sneathiella litorea]MZR32397.1 glycosyltransferase [Sneathiella litorea]
MITHEIPANNTIRLAMLVTRMDIGGVPDHIMTLLDGFGRNIDVTLITDSIHADHLADIENSGVKVHLLQMKRLVSVKSDLKALKNLRRILKDGQFNILHTHMSKAALLGAIVGTFSRDIIVVNTAHNLGFIAIPQYWKKAVFWAYDKIISALGFDAIITVSQMVANKIIRAKVAPGNRVHVITNGIRLQEFKASAKKETEFRREILGNAEGVIIVCVARLVWFKGIDTLINAFSRVLKEHPSARLAIIGDGELRDTLMAQTRQLGIEEFIHFCGERRDIPAILSASDLFVLSSVSEGLPISLLEAMAAQLPIVATDVGGISELILHGDTGYLVPARDPVKLAKNISDLLSDPNARRTLGKAGYNRLCTEFTQDAMVMRTEALYQQLLEGTTGEFVNV